MFPGMETTNSDTRDKVILCSKESFECDFNPISPGGEGVRLKGPDDQTHSCQSETYYSMMPKLCDF